MCTQAQLARALQNAIPVRLSWTDGQETGARSRFSHVCTSFSCAYMHTRPFGETGRHLLVLRRPAMWLGQGAPSRTRTCPVGRGQPPYNVYLLPFCQESLLHLILLMQPFFQLLPLQLPLLFRPLVLPLRRQPVVVQPFFPKLLRLAVLLQLPFDLLLKVELLLQLTLPLVVLLCLLLAVLLPLQRELFLLLRDLLSKGCLLLLPLQYPAALAAVAAWCGKWRLLHAGAVGRGGRKNREPAWSWGQKQRETHVADGAAWQGRGGDGHAHEHWAPSSSSSVDGWLVAFAGGTCKGAPRDVAWGPSGAPRDVAGGPSGAPRHEHWAPSSWLLSAWRGRRRLMT